MSRRTVAAASISLFATRIARSRSPSDGGMRAAATTFCRFNAGSSSHLTASTRPSNTLSTGVILVGKAVCSRSAAFGCKAELASRVQRSRSTATCCAEGEIILTSSALSCIKYELSTRKRAPFSLTSLSSAGAGESQRVKKRDVRSRRTYISFAMSASFSDGKGSCVASAL
eukprot:scaffold292178_cov27-Tisochrysis_lutea.AAC.2